MKIGMYGLVGLVLFAIGVGAAGAAPNGPLVLRWVGDIDTANAVILPTVGALAQSDQIRMDVDVKTSASGIRTVLLGQADLGGSGRYRIEGLPEESEVKFHPVAWDALVVVVNPGNPIGNLSVKALKQLLSGEVDNWRQLGGPDLGVRLILHEDSFSGVEYVLMNQLFGSSDVEFPSAELVADDFDIGAAVATDPTAVSVMSLATAMHYPVKPLNLDGVVPDVANLKAGKYRLFRPLYLVRAPKNQQDDVIDRAINFIESVRARPLIRAAGAVPYREAVVLVVRGMDIQRELASE